MGLPSVSVVMPVVNEERHLRASVLRILDQDYPGPLDVTLAVGPSHDNTAQVAAISLASTRTCTWSTTRVVPRPPH